MKTFFLLAAVLFASLVKAQSKIIVEVSNFNNDNGLCRACLFNTAESFNGDGKALQCIQVKISAKKAQFSFEAVAPGTYAISLFHDANSNNKIDKNFLGIPKEGYGASRNNLPFAAAPGFNGNKFEVKKGINTQLSVKLRYL